VWTHTGFDAGAALGGGGDDVKFVSISAGGHPLFVRHCNYHTYVTPISGQLDERDSTFAKLPGLSGSQFVSFESVNYPSYFLRYDSSSGRLRLVQNDGSNEFKQDSSFLVVPGLADPSGVSLRLAAIPELYVNWNQASSDPDGCTYIPRLVVSVSKISDDSNAKKNATFRFSEPNFNPAFHPWTPTVTGKAVVDAVVDSSGGYISAYSNEYKNKRATI